MPYSWSPDAAIPAVLRSYPDNGHDFSLDQVVGPKSRCGKRATEPRPAGS
jgi:hypothetical protein